MSSINVSYQSINTVREYLCCDEDAAIDALERIINENIVYLLTHLHPVNRISAESLSERLNYFYERSREFPVEDYHGNCM